MKENGWDKLLSLTINSISFKRIKHIILLALATQDHHKTRCFGWLFGYAFPLITTRTNIHMNKTLTVITLNLAFDSTHIRQVIAIFKEPLILISNLSLLKFNI
jgi:hypothetical protein